MTLLAFAVVIVAGAELAYYVFPPASSGTFALWPPVGVLFATLVQVPPARWVTFVPVAFALIVGTCGVAHGDLRTSFLLALTSSVEACAGAWLLQRNAGTSFSLSRVSHALALTATAAAVASAGALLAIVLDGSGDWAFWRSWWLMDVLGILLLAPVVIGWRAELRDSREIGVPVRLIELALALAGAALTAHAVFGQIVPEVFRAPAFLLPFFLWPAFRFGSAGTASSVLLICTVAMWHTTNGSGPLVPAISSADAWLLRSQGTAAMAGVSFLLLASVVSERREIALERARLVNELKTALAEIKALQGFIPICAWCHKVRDDAGFWQRLEIYLDAHTDATVSHSICPSCSASQHELLEEAAGFRETSEPAVSR